jgi:hypothetical protein
MNPARIQPCQLPDHLLRTEPEQLLRAISEERLDPPLGTPEHTQRLLARYRESSGCRREVIAVPAVQGTMLVVDRCSGSLADERLVAHLGADEPPGNAALICESYLRDSARGRCRRVVGEDLTRDPYREEPSRATDRPVPSAPRELRARGERIVFRLSLVPTYPTSELRWHRVAAAGVGRARRVSLREVTGALESYEPACELTRAALARHTSDAQVSVSALRNELVRLRESPIVLNRGLREAVLDAIELERLSMSEIALRCGRSKRDSKGNVSGETSWLARRLGLVAESGAARPTPWVHTDVLALIARSGIGVSPHEVELV